MKEILRLIRPKQWLKNVFVLVPMFFGGALTDGATVYASVVTFFAFCFMASAVYCFNDIVDVDDDRRHPVKCSRPIASGTVSLKTAYGLMALMVVMALVTPLLLPRGGVIEASPRGGLVGVLLFYFVLNLAYCAWLKRFAIVDVCVVAFGFVLRLLAGGFATGIALSKWIVMMTFLLTLFLSFAKRRDDVVRMEATGEAPRKNTIRYNLTFINQAITITASVTLVCYIMYTISPEVVARVHTDYLYLTTAYVLLGLLRYIQITVVDKKSGDPTKMMLQDRFTQIVVVLWALTFLFIIYF
ncbi:MAG: decaprenyl-phosphate phosphoribosyltransferase [Prevotella sp.]|nr:decaprenyl-phosphate phosphoribosyltransferase [Prevotella sp.]